MRARTAQVQCRLQGRNGPMTTRSARYFCMIRRCTWATSDWGSISATAELGRTEPPD